MAVSESGGEGEEEGEDGGEREEEGDGDGEGGVVRVRERERRSLKTCGNRSIAGVGIFETVLRLQDVAKMQIRVFPG